jgi:hypothetical protein
VPTEDTGGMRTRGRCTRLIHPFIAVAAGCGEQHDTRMISAGLGTQQPVLLWRRSASRWTDSRCVSPCRTASLMAAGGLLIAVLANGLLGDLAPEIRRGTYSAICLFEGLPFRCK